MTESKTSRAGFWWGVLLTLLYIGLIFFARGSDAWDFLWTHGKLNEVGDFLAGAFTPVALGWLIYGYFLQRQELQAQREELQATRETLSTQVDLLREQTDAERKLHTPNLRLKRRGGLQGESRDLSFRNLGGPAHNLEVTWSEEGHSQEESHHEKAVELLDTNKVFDFEIPDATRTTSRSYHIEARFISRRKEILYQLWQVKLTYEPSSAEIREITKEPQLLKEGHQPLLS